MNPHRSIVLSFLVMPLLCIASRLAAQDCDQILKWGVFDEHTVRSNTSVSTSLIKWLKTNQVSTKSSARNAGFAAGLSLPIDGIPVAMNLDGTWGESHSGHWSSAAADYLEKHDEARQSLDEMSKTASATIADAWSKCVGSKSGLILWFKQEPGSSDFVLHIGAKPLDPRTGVNLTVKEVRHSNNLKLGMDLKGTKLSADIEVPVSRLDQKAGSITVDVGNPSYGIKSLMIGEIIRENPVSFKEAGSTKQEPAMGIDDCFLIAGGFSENQWVKLSAIATADKGGKDARVKVQILEGMIDSDEAKNKIIAVSEARGTGSLSSGTARVTIPVLAGEKRVFSARQKNSQARAVSVKLEAEH